MKKKMKNWRANININKTAASINIERAVYDYKFGGFSPKVK